MAELPRTSGERTIRALERLGFVQVRQKGSHVILKRSTDEGEVGCVVPLHKALAVGTLKSILRQAKVSVEEFVQNL